MKQMRVILCVLGVSFAAGAAAQPSYGHIIPVYIEPFSIEATLNQTTNLLFHYTIKNVDRGSADIETRQLNDTVLLVKAVKGDFATTNLSVYTADGRLYAFTVRYAGSPAQLDIQLLREYATAGRAGNTEKVRTEDKFEYYSARAVALPGFWSGRKETTGKVGLSLKGLYAKPDVLFFPLRLTNRSKIGYNIAGLRFFVKDEKQIKRTASQQQELSPLYIAGDTSFIPGMGTRTVVAVLPSFTLPDKKRLHIILEEKNGGRNLDLRISEKSLVRAEEIKEQ